MPGDFPVPIAVIRAEMARLCPVHLLPDPLLEWLAARLRFQDLINVIAQAYRNDSHAPLPERILRTLQADWQIDAADLRHLPSHGPTVVLANHPTGLLDGVAMAAFLGHLRKDFQVLANEVLLYLPGFADFILPVDSFHPRRPASVAGLLRAVRLVRRGGLLLVFPAADAARFTLPHCRIRERAWRPAVMALLSSIQHHAPGVQVVPAHLECRNSPLYYTLGVLHPLVSTMQLAREFVNKEGARVTLRVGPPVDLRTLDNLRDDSEKITSLQQTVAALAPRPRSERPHPGSQPIHHR